MLSDTERAYLNLPADDRLELRVPSVLKHHAEQVAAVRHEKLSEFVLAAIAAAVGQGLAEVGVWQLTMTEQAELLKVLAQPVSLTPAMQVARDDAESLFGPGAVE